MGGNQSKGQEDVDEELDEDEDAGAGADADADGELVGGKDETDGTGGPDDYNPSGGDNLGDGDNDTH